MREKLIPRVVKTDFNWTLWGKRDGNLEADIMEVLEVTVILTTAGTTDHYYNI
jgi:hypothetical protein